MAAAGTEEDRTVAEFQKRDITRGIKERHERGEDVEEKTP